MNERDRPISKEMEPSVGELVESVTRKVVTAIVIAGGLIAAGLYSQAGPPRYQIVAADGRVFRIDTRSGTVTGCEGDRCAIVLRHGHEQELEDSLGPLLAPRPLAPPPQAAPAPAPAPAPQIAPPPAQAPAPAQH